jgi:hypothetical protein
MRRPFSSTSVPAEPRPRRETVCAPLEKLLEVWSSWLPALAAVTLRNNSPMSRWPLFWIWSRVMTVTGDGVSESMRLMLEPVTSIFSIFCCACAAVASASAPRACASAIARRVLLMSFMGLPIGFVWV